MAARIVELASCHRPLNARPRVRPVAPQTLPDAPPSAFQFWSGASRAAYVHTAYRLIDCPDVPPSVVVLVKVAPSGRRTVLDVIRVESAAPSLNLAQIRHQGAVLGADEVHVHMLAADRGTRRVVELDLKAGLLRTLGRAPRLAASA
ncbi:MAG: hypothetical protein ACOYLQ_11060 [Hyphomicrobiaceae bacterium]